nr:hypothetical protein [uncultured Mediterraneibacter sp.]
MKNISGNFVLCDIQTEYAECLFRFLTEQLQGNYQFHLFREPDKMMEFTEKSGADVLLICEEYVGQTEGLRGVRKRFILTELPDAGNTEGNGISIFRYQSADTIIKEILGELGESKRQYKSRDAPPVHGRRDGGTAPTGASAICEKTQYRTSSARGLIGVYSPVHRIGKTRFALRMGHKMAEQTAVLYLNMEGYAGGGLYFPQETEQDLGDLLYCLKQERGDYGLKISSMAVQSGGLDYIKPMKNELDLRAVRGKDWLRLIELIFEKCVYETVILDLGDCIDGLYDILKICDRVYMPYISDEASLAKIRQYEENLRAAGYEEILRRTVKRQMTRRRRNPDRGGV